MYIGHMATVKNTVIEYCFTVLSHVLSIDCTQQVQYFSSTVIFLTT